MSEKTYKSIKSKLSQDTKKDKSGTFTLFIQEIRVNFYDISLLHLSAAPKNRSSASTSPCA